MATIEAYLEALKALQVESACESLNPNTTQQTEFRFGQICGVQQGLRMAEELLNKQLEDIEENDDGAIPRRHSQNRRRSGTT